MLQFVQWFAHKRVEGVSIFSAHVDPPLHEVIYVAGEHLEEVSPFKYLGSSFTATGLANGEIKVRINVARVTFIHLRPSLLS